MTSLTLEGIKAPAVTNLTTSGTAKGIKLEWDDSYDETKKYVEIWRATTNNRASASKVYETISDTWVDTNVTTGDTYYYWIRTSSIYDREDGDWHPTGSTSGVEGETSTLGALELESEQAVIQGGSLLMGYWRNNIFGSASGNASLQRAAMSTSNYSSSGLSTSSGGISNSNLSSWATWTDGVWTGTIGYTGADWKGFITDSVGSVEWGTPSGTTGYVGLFARICCYNDTDSTTLYSSNPISLAKIEYDGSITYWAQRNFAIKHRNIMVGSSTCDDGDDYKMIIQLYKYRSDSGSSWDVKLTDGFIEAQVDFT